MTSNSFFDICGTGWGVEGGIPEGIEDMIPLDPMKGGSMIIAGIGSRETPSNILQEMEKIGKWCLEHHVWVRSGHAPGADQAFERGAEEYCEVFLPWPSFEEKTFTDSACYIVPKNWEHLFEHASQFHPAWDRLSQGVRKLMGRNSAQVLGENLDSPVDYVVCWTKDGGPTGGTGQAIRIALANNIPVLNMFHEEWNTAEKVISKIKGNSENKPPEKKGGRMREERGNLWDFQQKGAIAITTNGTVKHNGHCVMGRGCALEAKTRFPKLALELGKQIKMKGNHVYWFPEYNLYSFPVKKDWMEDADIYLIQQSCREISRMATGTVYIPRPGCGNGGLKWDDVKKEIEPLLDDRFVIVTF